MTFRTEMEIVPLRGVVKHSEGVLMLGSCFSDNIGGRLKSALFDVDINPFGTSFNPMSIAENLNLMISSTVIGVNDLFLHNGVWHCFNFHSSFSSSNKAEALHRMNSRLLAARKNLHTISTLIITLGTAFTFTDNESGKIVNNCHKLPAARFNRNMLSVAEIVECYTALINRLRAINPEIKIIFTVSPIRHLADGLAGNSLSKSVLHVAVDSLASTFADNVIYFPAYEIMLDDLRDYRFYAADMIHPSDTAIEYIYEKFAATFFEPDTAAAAESCEKLAKRLNHHFLTDNADAIAKFNIATHTVKEQLIKKYPYISNRV